jgi:hypothetical protein
LIPLILYPWGGILTVIKPHPEPLLKGEGRRGKFYMKESVIIIGYKNF